MKHFFIITNHEKDPQLAQTGRICRWLEERGCSCVISDSAALTAGSEPGQHPARHQAQSPEQRSFGSAVSPAASVSRGYRYTDPARVPEGTECVLVLGGDGTLLQAAGDLVNTTCPLLGINMGKLGYLAEIEMDQAFGALERVIRDECAIEQRMMLEGSICGRDQRREGALALNDIVLSRRGRFRVVEFNIYVDDAFLCSFQADGIIVSTPTGSTGYSLSAGGPIVSPDASLLMLTAVAPHTISSRPVILPDHVKITVELGSIGNGAADGAEVNFDGNTIAAIGPGDRVTIRKAANLARLVRVYHTSFVEILRRKMN